MGRGPGVSVSKLPNGRWRVRWREKVRSVDGVEKWAQRERVVADEKTAIALRAKVLRSLETGELPQVDAVREEEEVCSLEELFAGYLTAQAARGAAQGTIRAYKHRTQRMLAVIRQRHDIPEADGTPATLLTRNELHAATLVLREELSPSMLRSVVSVVVSAWTWGCDDTEEYPGLPPAPRDTRTLIPKAPVYRAPPAPTMAECDAVLRILEGSYKARRVALPVSVIGRCTGLRSRQILALTVGDVNLAAGALSVRTGKSAQEKAGRTVPIAPALRAYLAELVEGRGAEEGLVRRRAGTRANSYVVPSHTLSGAWQQATDEGSVREEVWKPANREIARPDHAFRAAFQAHLKNERIDKAIIDALVGHAEGLRERHYAGDDTTWPLMVEALALIPEIDWEGPQSEEQAPDNVVHLNRQ